MPYASNKQAAFMHIHHPDIASKWHEEGHGYVKGGKHDPNKRKAASKRRRRIKKDRSGWMKPLVVGTATGTVGGALANQLPSYEQRERKKAAKKAAESRGKVSKLMAPEHPDDGWYNHRAAQQMFDLIMKMDDDTAQMFSYFVCTDIFNETVDQNLGMIQKALNRVFDKRMEMVKKALVRMAAKTSDPKVIEYAKAVREVEEFSKAVGRTPQYYGYTWKESDFRRDPGTGRFAVKVHHTMTKPLPRKQSENVIGDHGPKGMNDKQRAQYQDEYRQVAAFLAGVQGVGGAGDTDVIYHLEDKAGNSFSRTGGLDMPKDLLENPNTKLVAMEAKPTTLTAGGAAYGLMGGLSGEQVDRANRAFSQQADQGIKGMVSQWSTAGQEMEQTNRVFSRLNATGQIAGMAPPGSKVQIAGKMAEIVGEFGPEAEKVIGPTARKTAYRYRGTEKKPEKALVAGYSSEIADAKRYGVTEEDVDQRLLGFGTQREPGRGDILPFGQRRATGAKERVTQAVTPAVGQMGAAQALQAARPPTWAERGAGSARVADYLRQKLPDKQLYRLHLQAGNTPPSEGVIIDSKGQLAVQAVGYGDDHYLPFNLKNLKSLKGGEYIRNRSVGGLTSEDVYAGLMSGARRVTVVSRSGTFTMEFEPDFRGGRRYNDKALRMTRRYENILDAVQSGQVDRTQIPPQWRQEIKNEVIREYPPDTPKAILRDEIKNREKEFKENPDIDGRDLERAERMIAEMESKAAMGGVSEKDAAMYRRQVMNQLHNMKEVRFRLNGVGYEAGLKSLQEQFPYYIKSVKSRPTRDEELLEFELDEGYVEPGRNRPTGARAGLYGTGLEPGSKYSAALAGHQQGRNKRNAYQPNRAAVPAPVEAAASTAQGAATVAAAAAGTGLGAGAGRAEAQTETPESGLGAGPGRAEKDVGFVPGPGKAKEVEGEGGGGDKKKKEAQKTRDVLSQEFKVRSAKKVAVELRDDLKTAEVHWEEGSQPEWWDMGDETFKDYISKPENMDTFHRDMEKNREKWSKQGSGLPHFAGLWARFSEARGASKQVKYQKSNAGHFPAVPYSFAELESKDAYHVGARYAEVQAEMGVIDGRPASTCFTTNKKLSQLDSDEMRDEIEVTGMLRQAATGASAETVLNEFNRTWPKDTPPTTRVMSLLTHQDKIDDHLEQVHRMRYLQEMLKQSKNKPGAATGGKFVPRSNGGGAPGGSSGGPAAGPTPSKPETPEKPPENSGGSAVLTATEDKEAPHRKIVEDARVDHLERAGTAIRQIRRELKKPSLSNDDRARHTEDLRAIEEFTRVVRRAAPTDTKFIDEAYNDLNDRQSFRVTYPDVHAEVQSAHDLEKT